MPKVNSSAKGQLVMINGVENRLGKEMSCFLLAINLVRGHFVTSTPKYAA